MGAIWYTFVGFLEQVLLWFATLTGSIGIGIIIFTICTRLVILPLTLSSIRSSRKMQELQPLIKELQRKYGKDQRKLQEETVKLYQQYRINPVGGCLPLLLQLPIFFGVYQAVYHLMVAEQRVNLSEAVRGAVVESNVELLLNQPLLGGLWRFIGLQDASTITTLLNQPFLGLDLGLAPFDAGFTNFHGPVYLILPVLSVVLQFVQQVMATPRVQDPQQKMMTQTMMFMPLVFGYIAFTFPSGAVLYWVTSSLIGIVQQYFTSGWGSLANHLKFLPPDRGPQPALALAPATSLEGGATVSVPAAPRQTFWEVLSPLVEPETATQDKDKERGMVLPETEMGTEVQHETENAMEQAIESTEHQAKPNTSPRRVRRRR